MTVRDVASSIQIAHWKLPSLTLSAFSRCLCSSNSGTLLRSRRSMISDSLSDSAFSSGSDLGGETPDVRRRLLGAGAEGLEEGGTSAVLFRLRADIFAGVCVFGSGSVSWVVGEVFWAGCREGGVVGKAVGFGGGFLPISW